MKLVFKSLMWTFLRFDFIRTLAYKFYKEMDNYWNVRTENELRLILNNTVATGPFAGLKYPQIEHSGSHTIAPKLLGIYEFELSEAIERLINRHPNHVLNIGSADGYFTAGLAMRLPKASVIAWEMDETLQRTTSSLCLSNSVSDRVKIKGICTPAELQRLELAGKALIICDCEGAEIDLLQYENLRGLEQYDILVECHDMFRENATKILMNRFNKTHDIQAITTSEHSLDKVSPVIIKQLTGSKQQVLRALDEARLYSMTWLVMTTKVS